MDIDKFAEIAQMLDIQHIPKTFMIYKGDLVDQFGGVPQDEDKIKDFFEKAAAFGDGADEGVTKEQAIEEKTASKSGLIVHKLNEGTGPVVPTKTKVKVHYTGKLADGTVFDSSVQRGEPIEFVVGVGQVIRGWDEGILQL